MERRNRLDFISWIRLSGKGGTILFCLFLIPAALFASQADVLAELIRGGKELPASFFLIFVQDGMADGYDEVPPPALMRTPVCVPLWGRSALWRDPPDSGAEQPTGVPAQDDRIWSDCRRSAGACRDASLHRDFFSGAFFDS